MKRTGDRVTLGLTILRAALPAVLLVAVTIPAFAAPGSGGGVAHLDTAAMQSAAGDVVLGAGAATAILAGMVVVVAASWRGFREMLRVGDEDEDPIDPPAPRRRRGEDEA
jgi:hypothetical protein